METKICNNQQEWDNWLLSQKQAQFLQSWGWGEFQHSMGQKPVRLQFLEDGSIKGQVQGMVHELGLGIKYLYVPRMVEGRNIVDPLFKWAKKNGFSFVRIEPSQELGASKIRIVNTFNRQPKQTLLLDLSKSDEELLKEMHSKTRYNIRLGQKKEIELKFEKNAEVFWRLNEETIQRDKFRSHGEAYYHSMLSKNFSYQITAHYNFQPIASIVLISFGDSCVYLHGASSNEHRNLMAPYLLQWKGIQMAKKLGCKYYDFWGIAPPTTDGGKSSCFNDFCWQADHEWTGVTRFKVGFGGEVKEFPDSIDIAIKRSAYWLYKVIRKVKGLK